jgi:hypothetical protein
VGEFFVFFSSPSSERAERSERRSFLFVFRGSDSEAKKLCFFPSGEANSGAKKIFSFPSKRNEQRSDEAFLLFSTLLAVFFFFGVLTRKDF